MDRLNEIVEKIYEEMYLNAEPKGDWVSMRESGEVTMPDFFMAYYMPMDEQTKIMEDVISNHKLKNREKDLIRNTIYLGSSPCSNKERTTKERLTYKQRLADYLEVEH
jgi:hypothetical protein